MISVEEQRALYVKILEMSRSTLKMLDEDRVEDAMNLNADKFEIIKYLAENRNKSDSIKTETREFCNDYFTLNEQITVKIAEIREKIQFNLKNGRVAIKKVCAYQTVSQVGRN